MTDHEYDFDLGGFKAARINSAHRLGDYVVELWDDDWEDRFWAEMEEIKAKEIFKFQEQLAQEVFHQPATEPTPGGSLTFSNYRQPSEFLGSVGEQRRGKSPKHHEENLEDIGNGLMDQVAALRHLDIEQNELTNAMMVDGAEMRDDAEAPPSSTAAEDTSEEDSGLPLSSSLTGSATVETAPSTPANPPNDTERDKMNERKKPSLSPSPPLLSPQKPKDRSQINTPMIPNRITKQRKPRPRTTFTWLHPHRMTIAITIKHFNLSWSNLERVFSYLYPEDVKRGGKVPGSAEWAGNIRFQWVRESRTFKSAKYYDPVQAEIEVEEGKESVEYRKILADVVDAMGTLGIMSRLGAGERKVLEFTKK